MILAHAWGWADTAVVAVIFIPVVMIVYALLFRGDQ